MNPLLLRKMEVQEVFHQFKHSHNLCFLDFQHKQQDHLETFQKIEI